MKESVLKLFATEMEKKNGKRFIRLVVKKNERKKAF